jgi:hypothetical protein
MSEMILPDKNGTYVIAKPGGKDEEIFFSVYFTRTDEVVPASYVVPFGPARNLGDLIMEIRHEEAVKDMDKWLSSRQETMDAINKKMGSPKAYFETTDANYRIAKNHLITEVYDSAKIVCDYLGIPFFTLFDIVNITENVVFKKRLFGLLETNVIKSLTLTMSAKIQLYTTVGGAVTQQ